MTETDLRPSGNWRRMHVGWGDKPKQRHRTWLAARWHLRDIRRKHKTETDLMWVYPCWFTDENTLGRRHWHVGHLPKSRRLRAGPRPGTLFLGVFAVEDGFEVRTFEVRPATCFPARPTVAEALREYQQQDERGSLWSPGAAGWAAISTASPATRGLTRSTSSRLPGG